MTAHGPHPLQGKKILIVEDEALVALEVEALLRAAGATVAGPVARVAKALSLLERERLDAAVLDLNLHGELPAALAEALSRKNVPFVIVTGYSEYEKPPFHRAQQLQKPVDAERLISALHSAMSSGDGNGV